jgi:hypothetical protein
VRKKNKGKGVKMKSADVNDDKVYTYARELLSYGLFYKCFSDGIREGDGGECYVAGSFYCSFLK